MDFKTNTDFRSKIYHTVARIPRGKVATYGQIASLAGSPGAARAVGTAMKDNPYMPHVPCHRVVGSNGSMHGYSGKNGVNGKKQMLLEEGVMFDRERVNLKTSQWDEQ